MALPNDKNMIARIAFNERLREEGASEMPEHMIEDAKFYVDEALGHMENQSTYDPETYAGRLAMRGIIEYVKAKLGAKDPLSSQKYGTAYAQWRDKAAEAWVVAQEEEEGEASVLAKGVFVDLIDGDQLNPQKRHYKELVGYVKDAPEAMREASTYDPEEKAVKLAELVKSEFARAKIRGRDPFSFQPFVRALRRWTRRAAAQHYRDADNEGFESRNTSHRLR